MKSTARPSLLDLLRKHNHRYLAGPELARQLGLSRTAVWKRIKRLQQRGYTIDVRPRKGYRLVRSPDLVLAEEVQRQLGTRRLAKTFHYFAQTTSTNDEAMRLAVQGAPDGTVVCAEYQSAGRGRLNREWVAPAQDALTFSIILRPRVEPRQGPQVTLAVALAIARVLREDYRLPAAIKWPNDILISGRKVVGILTELQAEQDRVKFLVVGIGINVNQEEQDFRGSFRYPPTSLKMESGRRIARVELLCRVLAAIESYLERMLATGFAGLNRDLEDYCVVMGKEIELECLADRLVGRVIGFTSEGALRLLDREGTQRVVWAGDIVRVLTTPRENPATPG